MKRLSSLSFFNKVVLTANLLLAFLLLLSICASLIPVERLPTLALFSLVTLVLVGLNILFTVYWMIIRKRLFLISLTLLIISYFAFGTIFKINLKSDTTGVADLSIMSFNSRAFNKNAEIDKPDLASSIMEFLKLRDPDIICFQEFDYKKRKEFKEYPYSYVKYIHKTGTRTVQAIFSKYPIVSEGSLDFPKSYNNAIYCDVAYGQDTLRIYNLHLESFKVIPTADAISEEPKDRLLKRLKKSFLKQSEQAQLFDMHSDSVSYKKIICGDFNNTQFSWVYRKIKGDMKDTFLEAGKGFGSTYDYPYLPFRIDFILVDESFQVKTHKTFEKELSDHFPVMSSIRLTWD